MGRRKSFDDGHGREDLRLFDLPPEPPVRDVSLGLKQAAHWHASTRPEIPGREESWRHEAPDENRWSGSIGHPLGLHVGSGWAAHERLVNTDRRLMIPVRLSGETAVAAEDSRAMTDWGEDYDYDGEVWDDNAANGRDPASTRAIRSGKNVHYLNESEDAGALSIRAPRQNLATWAEHVVRNPHLYDHAERRAAASGADLVYVKEGAHIHQPHPAPRGLTATPITLSPTGTAREEWEAAGDWVDDPDDIMPLPEATINPAWVFPHKRAAARREELRQEEQTQLSLPDSSDWGRK